MARSTVRSVGDGRPRFASLFCGCGGLDLGFLRAGFSCERAYDLDPVAVHVHNQNLGAKAEVCDLTDGIPIISELSDLEVLLAGSPCQGFSTAGKRKLDDPRNELLLLAGNAATALRPSVFLAENVCGVLSGKHRMYWERLRTVLVGAGYRTEDLVLEGTQLGVPQIRKRIVMIAWRNGGGADLSLTKRNGGVLRDALQGLVGLPDHKKRWLPRNSLPRLIARRIGPCQKLSNARGGVNSIHTWDIPEVFGPVDDHERQVLNLLLRLRRQHRLRDNGDADPVPVDRIVEKAGRKAKAVIGSLVRKGYVRNVGGSFDLTHTFNGKYRRLSWDKPSFTVDTRFGDIRYFVHPDEDRGFTVREAARIQGFPDEFVFGGSEKKQYELVGNAVPPLMAESLAILAKTLL